MIRISTISNLFIALFATLCLTFLFNDVADAKPLTASGNTLCSNVTEIPQTECEALIDFYNGTGGPNWTDKSGWLVTNQPCSWFGVTCAGGSVTRLQFVDLSQKKGNRLKGTIPASIENLSNLINLILDFNELGHIPPYIGNLKKLQWLTMGSNHLQSIPPEIGNLTSLTGLSLMSNEFKTLPPEIGKLTNLRHLNLISNRLETLPSEIGGLVNLEVMYLENNQLHTLPPEMGNLEKLQGLRMYNNQLVSLPSEIGNLSNLVWARLDGNQLSSLPPEIGNLSSLVAIRLENNQLTALPTDMGRLMNLEELTLRDNQIRTLPSEMGNLAKLRHLDLGQNQLSGSILPELGNLTNLEYLYLYSNQLSGPIPAKIGNMTSLKNLQLEYNQLSGPIPPEIGRLTNLENLHLEYNQLSGPIPAEIGRLMKIDHLVLAANQLSGPVPPEIGKLTQVDRLYLHQNLLSGSLPDEFENLKPSIFYFNDTQLCLPDTLTTWFSNIPNRKGTLSCSEVGPNMAINKSASAQIVGNGVYTLNVTNVGTKAPEDSTWVFDTLPTGITPIEVTTSDAGWNCTIQGQDVECEYDQPFLPNQSHEILIEVAVTDQAAQQVENCAVVDIEDDIDYDNNESCIQTEVKPMPQKLYVSSTTGGKVGNVKFADEDILVFDSNTNTWGMYFDGSDMKLQKWDVNAFHVLENGNILMSFHKPIKIAGVQYDDSDILLFTANSLGYRTSGTFSMYFDGSQAKLTKSSEDIDAIGLTRNGDLIISTLGNANVGFAVKDEDLLRFTPTSLGNTTSGTWHHFFDGSDIGLTAKTEDVSAVWMDTQTGTIHLSTLGNFKVSSLGTNLKGDNEDIFTCNLVPNTQGNTHCQLARFWNGDQHGFSGESIDGYAVQSSPTGRRVGSTTIIHGDPGADEVDNEPDLTEDQDDDVLDEEDVQGRVYLPLVNQ